MSYIEPHKRGDTWGGVEFTLTELQPDLITYLPINLTGCSVLMQFRKSHNSAIVMEFSTTDATITIPNPLNGKIKVIGRDINLSAGDIFMYDVQLTYANGVIETLFEDTWLINNDISRKQ